MPGKQPEARPQDWVWIGYPETGGTERVTYAAFTDVWETRGARLLTDEEVAATETLGRHVLGPALLTLTTDERSLIEQNTGLILEAPKAAEVRKAEKEIKDLPAVEGGPLGTGNTPAGGAQP